MTAIERYSGRSRALALSVLASLLACGTAGAADDTVADPPAQAVGQRLYRATRIVGSGVRDGKDRPIGEVKDLVLGSRRGNIAYAVIAFGGSSGGGGRYYAVPWQALQASDDGSYYTLQVDPQTISRAPGFDRGNWPDFADRGWSLEVDRYWDRMVGPEAGRANRLSSGVSGSHSPANDAPGSGAPAAAGRRQSGR